MELCRRTSVFTAQVLSTYLFVGISLFSAYCSAYTGTTIASSTSHQGFQFFDPNSSTSSLPKLDQLLLPLLSSVEDAKNGRSLQTSSSGGDFASLNTLLKNARILLPDTQIKQFVVIADLEVNLTDIYCDNIAIQNIQMPYVKNNNQTLNTNIVASEATMVCFAQYVYAYSVMSGNGQLHATTAGNRLETDLVFSSSNFNTAPPTSVTVQNCSTTVNVTGLIFSGGAIASIATAFESLIKRIVENQVNGVACAQLDKLGTSMTATLDKLNTKLDLYLQPLPMNRSNPLYAEQALTLSSPAPPNLVNFLSKNNSLLINTLIQFLQNQMAVLGQPVSGGVSGSSGNSSDLAINAFLRNNLLDSQGGWMFNVSSTGNNLLPMFNSQNQLVQTNMSFDSVRIFGLDTITKFEPLQFIGKQTIQNNFSWQYLRWEANVTIEIQPSTLNSSFLVDPNATHLTETLTLNFQVDNVNVDLALLLAIDQDKLLSTELGSLLWSKNLLPCMLSTLYEVQVTGLNINVSSIENPSIAGFNSVGLDQLFSSMIGIFFVMYEPTILTAMPNIFQLKVRDLINNQLFGGYLANQDSTCPAPNVTDGLIDLRDLMLPPSQAVHFGGTGNGPYGDMFPKILSLIQTQLFEINPATNLSKMNDLFIDPMTLARSGQAGRLDFQSIQANTASRVSIGSLNLDVRLIASNAYVANLNTVGAPLVLLENVMNEACMLNNTASIGIGNPLAMGMHLYFGLTGQGTEISDDMDISINMDVLTAMLTAFLQVSDKAFMTFPLGDILNLNCWLATIPAPSLDANGIRLSGSSPTLSIADLGASVSRAGLNLTCINCTSPLLNQMAQLQTTPEAIQSFTETMNSILAYITSLLGGQFVQITIDRMLNEATRKCQGGNVTTNYPSYVDQPASKSTAIGLLFAFLVFVLAAVVIALAILLLTKILVRRRHRNWIQRLPSEQVWGLWLLQSKDAERKALLDATTTSMITSPAIPLFVRWFIPVVIIGNIAFFLSGHLSLGATVELVFTLGGQTMTAGQFYEFSMMRSTVEIWDAGGKALATLILIFSIIWPYVKQLTSLALWVSPPRCVSVPTRGEILHWLDVLAKWSMVDIFVLVVTITGFRVSVQSPELSFLPNHFYSLELLVVPMWGLYANMIAQMISQISSHFIIHYHRRIIESSKVANEKINGLQAESALKEDEEFSSEPIVEKTNEIQVWGANISDNNIAESLKSHAFHTPHRGNGETLIARRIVHPLLIFVALASAALFIVGCIMPSLSIEILGLVGIFVEAGQQFADAKTNYNLFTMIRLLFAQADFLGRPADYVGLGCLAVLLVCTVLVVPLVLIFVLVWLWFRPLNKKSRNRLKVAVEILQAWEYGEVYLASILVGSWQLGQVSAAMVNEYCASLDAFFARLVYYGIIAEKDAQCFRVDAAIQPGSIVLIAACVLLAILNTFVMRAVAQRFRDELASQNESETIHPNYGNDESVSDVASRIHPPPVLFTDLFHWLLRPMNISCSSTSLQGDSLADSA